MLYKLIKCFPLIYLAEYPNWMPDFGAASISLHDQLIFLITIILIYILQ